jgi:hypothetical protein
MNIESLFNTTLVPFLLRGFASVFAFLYLLYSFALFGQVRALSKTLTTDFGYVIIVGTAIQLGISIILLLSMILLWI